MKYSVYFGLLVDADSEDEAVELAKHIIKEDTAEVYMEVERVEE